MNFELLIMSCKDNFNIKKPTDNLKFKIQNAKAYF